MKNCFTCSANIQECSWNIIQSEFTFSLNLNDHDSVCGRHIGNTNIYSNKKKLEFSELESLKM